jgi:hypothetical protein
VIAPPAVSSDATPMRTSGGRSFNWPPAVGLI